MVLELHIWGPAFGLPSIDPESLAAIAFITQTLPRDQYQLIQSSPSAVPTHQLPTIYNPTTQTYHSGYPSITTHLSSLVPASTKLPSRSTAATTTAYTAFLTSHAAPLLALSLYVSSANWSSTVRPAYSKILPFPLGWTEPPAIRATMSRRAEHLGMLSLDTDATEEREEAEREAAAAQGWINVPKEMGKAKGVGGAMAPEQRARIRLEGLAGEVLDVLGEVDWKGEGVEVGVRCLVWAYLALMVVPEVPRGWLGETVRGKYVRLGELVDWGREEWFGMGVEGLPWRTGMAEGTVVRVGGRFVNGLLGEIPAFGEPWRRWWARRKLKATGRVDALQEGSGELWQMAGMGVALVVSALLWRKLPQLGQPLQVWQKPLPGFLGLGAAGFMFGHLAETTIADQWR
ncbi:Tom37 C-terminal domain-containing protein [Podospora aff. communis PSN243]|uniref:Tom37 C-terminal domain-containing protein n=1 Tax=Podospora aff. communis PSN243 TaxID=3040156 RepID=A0AAV9H3L3_9PEZI|nr:Tom37 C-terminal domain-containing protein [Podospora aff. communis PSN243]